MFSIKTLYQSQLVENITTLFSILLPLAAILVTTALLFVLPKKNEKAVKITKLVMASLILFFYLFRAAFWIARVATAGIPFAGMYIFKTFGLDLNMWLTLICSFVMFYSALTKKDCKFVDILKYTLLGIALPLSIIKFLNPLFGITSFMVIDTTDRWYHIVNLCNMLISLCQIVFPLYLIKIKDIKAKLENYWKAIAGYVLIMSIVSTVALLFGRGVPTYYTNELYSPYVIVLLGIKIDFPWHLLINYGAFILISFLVYLVTSFVSSKIIKEEQQQLSSNKTDEFLELYAFATKSILCMQGILLIIILDIVFTTKISIYWSIFMLVPFVMTIFCLLSIFKMENLSKEYNEEFYNPNNKDYLKVRNMLLVGDVFFALAFIKQYKNEIASIEDRKKRAEKKRLKELKKQEAETQTENKE